MFNERRAHWTALALLLARCVLGLIFFMAGIYKVFTLTPIGHAEKFFLPFADTFLPVWSLWAVGCTVPFVELFAGALYSLGGVARWRIRRSERCLFWSPLAICCTTPSTRFMSTLFRGLHCSSCC